MIFQEFKVNTSSPFIFYPQNDMQLAANDSKTTLVYFIWSEKRHVIIVQKTCRCFSFKKKTCRLFSVKNWKNRGWTEN